LIVLNPCAIERSQKRDSGTLYSAPNTDTQVEAILHDRPQHILFPDVEPALVLEPGQPPAEHPSREPVGVAAEGLECADAEVADRAIALGVDHLDDARRIVDVDVVNRRRYREIDPALQLPLPRLRGRFRVPAGGTGAGLGLRDRRAASGCRRPGRDRDRADDDDQRNAECASSRHRLRS
jgi:hypothetical protein